MTDGWELPSLSPVLLLLSLSMLVLMLRLVYRPLSSLHK
jgi:hypothetical protein